MPELEMRLKHDGGGADYDGDDVVGVVAVVECRGGRAVASVVVVGGVVGVGVLVAVVLWRQ